ncbi:MAG TPA: immunoglobulin-like domain-containing protein [Bacteroidia bacterium]
MHKIANQPQYRFFFFFLSALFFIALIWISGCMKRDSIPPVITLNGSHTMTIFLNTPPSPADPGATARDNQDGNLTTQISSDWSSKNPNIYVKGIYIITYSVSDAAGNKAYAKRTVYVRNQDDIPPAITLLGNNPMNIVLNTSPIPSNPGATAMDNKDGNLTSKIISDWSNNNPNDSLKGIYIIHYSVADSAGNVATATRTVNVVNSAEYLSGTYFGVDSCRSGNYTFSPTIISSSTQNNRIVINNFGDFGTGVNVYADVNGNTITVPAFQHLSGSSFIVSGSGTIKPASSPVQFTISYSWNNGSTTESCHTTYGKK